MTSDVDPTLETDHLDQLLETPAPQQPVVVVQYRDRGIPPWVFVSFVIAVIPVALFVYHRTVVERYRVQAAEDRSLLALKIKEERALLPLVRDTPASKAVLPEPKVAADGPANAGDTDPAKSSAEPVTAGDQPAAEPPADSDPPKLVAGVGPAPSRSNGQPPGAAPPAFAGAGGGSAPVRNQGTPEPAADTRTSVAQAGTTVPAGVSDPFAELEKPTKPSNSPGRNESAPGSGTAAKTVSAETVSPAGESASAAIRSRQFVIAPETSPAAAVAAVDALLANRDRTLGPQALVPLPTKEETERSIEEEAAKLKAEKETQIEGRNAELRGQRLVEQLRFRDELREVLRSKGNHGGPDIAKLFQRYDYDVDPERRAQAFNTWRFSKKPVREKIRLIRALDLPETTILQFMCASIDPQIGTRDGPRDTNEVWVRAAEQLLRYDLPRATVGPRPGNGAAVEMPPTRKTVVSTPR